MIASKIVAVSRTTLPFHIHRLRLRPAAGALLCTVRAPFCGITRTLTSSTSASSTVSASAPLSLSARRANRASNRAARAATAAQNAINSASSTGSASAPPAVSSGILWNSAIIIPSALIGWYIFSKDDKNSIPVRLLEFSGFNKMWDNATEGFTKPHADKLLPDWPMPNVPPDLPCPHTLVLDLENTLVSSTWDRKHGWRHAKRPGVDQFLRKMAQYYEIVLYTSTIQGVAEPVIQNLDKQQAIMHALYRESTRFIDGVHVKDLSSLNRNVKKIIAIDNDEKALQLHPDNLIRVKPYTDPRNRTDDTLEKIMPILIEIVNKGYDDIPAILRQYRGMDADEIVEHYQSRVDEIRKNRDQIYSSGLGWLNQRRNNPMPEPELPPASSSMRPSGTPAITSKDLVGDAPLGFENGKEIALGTGSAVSWFQTRQKEKQEQEQRKMEKWNEVMLKRQKDIVEKAAKTKEKREGKLQAA